MLIFITTLVVFFAIFITLLTIYEFKQNDVRALKKATILFDFNTHDKTFQIKHWKHLKIIIPHWMSKNLSILSESHQPISEWKNLFDDDNLIKEIRKCFSIMDDKDEISFSFSFDFITRKQNIKLFFEFNKFSNINGKGKIIWKEMDKNEDILHIGFDCLTRKISNKDYYRMYLISFSKILKNNYLLSIAKEVQSEINGDIFFFEESGFLYFILISKLKDDIEKGHNIIKKFFINNKAFYERHKIAAMTFTPIKNERLTSFKAQTRMKTLDYLSYRITNKKEIYNLNNTGVHSEIQSDPLYKKYMESYKNFKYLLSTEQINMNIKKVYNIKTNKVISYLLIPTFKNLINDNQIEMINLPRWERKIRDVFSKKVILAKDKSKKDKSQIIEVSCEWFIDNYKNINNKNYLYLININDQESIQKLFPILSFLYKSKAIKCGIKIEYNSRINLYLLKKLKIFFLVIDEGITLRWNENIGFSTIFLLKRIFMDRGLKIIYTNPKTKLDEILDTEFNAKYAFFN